MFLGSSRRQHQHPRMLERRFYVYIQPWNTVTGRFEHATSRTSRSTFFLPRAQTAIHCVSEHHENGCRLGAYYKAFPNNSINTWSIHLMAGNTLLGCNRFRDEVCLYAVGDYRRCTKVGVPRPAYVLDRHHSSRDVTLAPLWDQRTYSTKTSRVGGR
jgi:hypothetical protein